MIVDFHAHCFPDSLAARAMQNLHQASGLPYYHNGTAAGLIRSTRQAGIDRVVVQPIATRPDQVDRINRWILEIQGDTLLGFGTLHPDSKKWPAEIAHLKSAGLRGIKFHPEYQGFFVDDPRYFPLYEATFAAGLMILFHAGADLAFDEPCRCTPARLSTVLDAFPGGTVIAAHMGGYHYWDEVENLLIGREIYLDTSFSAAELGTERMTRMIRQHGTSKILFGTDSPWKDQAGALAEIRNLKLMPAEESAILGGNAVRMLGIG